jgi:hypothetical protein
LYKATEAGSAFCRIPTESFFPNTKYAVVSPAPTSDTTQNEVGITAVPVRFR